MKTMYQMVEEFNRTFHPIQLVDYNKLIEEEYEEWLEEAYKPTETWNDAKELKELCDLIYVILGHAYSMGFDIEGAFKAVHESNMSKLDDNGIPLYNESGKVMKGPNYRAPNLHQFV